MEIGDHAIYFPFLSLVDSNDTLQPYHHQINLIIIFLFPSLGNALLQVLCRVLS